MDRYSKVQKKIKSPRRQAINKELDEHTLRIKELMQQDYILLEQQNVQLKKKCMKVKELQQKVELVLKNNQQLFIENGKLAKLVEQKIEECQILKKKMDSTKRANEGMNQYERKKLLLQIERLQKQIEEVEHFKSLTIKQIKTKQQIQFQNLRRDHQGSIRFYDDQLIKLKETLDKKDIEINLLLAKIRKFQADNQFQVSQLKQQKAKLKEQIKKLESHHKLYESLKEEHAKFIEERKKYDENNSNRINGLTKQYEKLLDSKKKQDENNASIIKDLTQKYEQLKQERRLENDKNSQKLNQIIQKYRFQQEQSKNSKNRIKDLEDQNSLLELRVKKQDKKIEENQEKLEYLKKIKEDGENSEQKFKREVQSLKNQIKQLNLINNREVEALREKYQTLRQQQMAEIRIENENFRHFMEQQIQKLQEIIRIKDDQLGFLSEQKSLMKQMFIEEGNQMKNQLIMLQNQYRETQMVHKQELRKLQQQYRIKNKKLEEEFLVKLKKCQSGASDHIHKIESDLLTVDREKRKLTEEFNKKNTQSIAYKQIIQNQKEEIKLNLKKAQEKQKLIKKSEQEWKKSCMDMKNRLEMQQEQWQKTKLQIKKNSQQKYEEASKSIKEKQRIIQKLQSENESIKQFVNNRDKNIEEINKNVSDLNRLIDQKNQMIDNLRSQIVVITQKGSAKNLNDKKKIQQYYQEKIKFLTQDFQSKVYMLETKLGQVTIQLNQKQREIDQLIKQYKKMREQMVALTQLDANKKDITLKFPGATADLIATKNMFDVFIKQRVMTVCKEAIKQNVSRQ